MRLMRMLGVALLWAVGVALVASMSWVAINSAGRQVVETTISAATSSSGTQGGAMTDQTEPTSSSVTTPAPPSSSSASGPTPSGAGSRKPGSTAMPSATGSSPGGHTSTRTPEGGDGDPTTPPTTSGPSPLSDTLSTPGGVVWLQCTGPQITNYLAQPSSDWAGNAGVTRSGTLMVDFVHDGNGIRIAGTCPSGQPHFDVANFRRHDGDKHDGDGHDD